MKSKPIPESLSPRVVVESLAPEIDSGLYAVKRTAGEEVRVTADVFADGHDVLQARLRFRRTGDRSWSEVPMTEVGKDLWEARFSVTELGEYEYTVCAWLDRFQTWQRDLRKKLDAEQDVSSELLEGAALIRRAAERASPKTAKRLEAEAERVSDSEAAGLDAELTELMESVPDRSREVTYPRTLRIVVERERARWGAWYEMFPRSAGSEPGKGGAFRDVEALLPEIASMGFDVLYLPPIHPIGTSNRKGPDNRLEAGPEDPGSPWAIGSHAGGHKAVDPGLGTLADFDHLVSAARKAGLEIALDVAFQCSPDHPYVKEHPEWFRHRPDGSIKYAENPPKKYQDIYPFDFECEEWQSLWRELLDVVRFWAGRGVRIFRVDNPHTKTLGFWEWLITSLRSEYRDVVFLSEAFTRPKVMKNLAKRGFSQSYTYFTWRNTKQELTSYFTELTATDVREYLRPNLFVNTPDILHEYLQFGGRPAFMIRLVLAATLGASYGVYGPPFELCEANAVPGTEEYQDSEKYQIRTWERKRTGSLRDFLARVNRIRRENAALRSDWSLRFHEVENERLLFYSKRTKDLGNAILVVVNLDPHHPQSGWLTVPLEELGIAESEPYQVHDLLGGARYLWSGARNYVSLDPLESPAYALRLRRKIKSERDFDYFL